MNKEVLKIFFKPLTLVNRWMKKDDHLIFLYANLGFRDNVRAFFDYLIAQGYHKKYRIVVSCGDYENFVNDAPDNVTFIGNRQGIRVFLKAKYAFYCFGKYPIKPAETQTVVNLWHGMPLKRVGNMEPGLERIDYNFFTYIIATSELFVPILMQCFSCSRKQVVVAGQPRNDEMFRRDPLTDEVIRRGADKVVVWLPTYRKEKKSFPTPVLQKKDADALNKMLKAHKTRLIIKIHPLQKVTDKLQKYSNIEFMSQEELDKSKMTVYTLLRAADGLISDYSSVFFDYMMLDRPIAFTVDDMEEYAKERGFVFEDPYAYMPGEKISTYEDLQAYLMHVIAGEDVFAGQRRALNKEINAYIDGDSCERVAELAFWPI